MLKYTQMIERYVPFSDRNAEAFELDTLSHALTEPIPMSAPVERDDVMLMGLPMDVAKAYPNRISLEVRPLENNEGFAVVRTDIPNGPIQAQRINTMCDLPPFGRHVFHKPITILPVHHDLKSGNWRIETDPENINKINDLIHLVYVLSRHTRKKLIKAGALPEDPDLPERPLIGA
jgi:hypothetical protein